VVQLFALQIDLRAAQMLGQPRGEIERRGTTRVVRAQVRHLGDEFRIVLCREIGRLEIADQRHQRFGDVAPAEDTEAAVLIGAGTQ
jgi:hypothetical protein